MSAVRAADSPTQASLRPMRETDLDLIMQIEETAYPFPWTRGIFRDCLRAGYSMWVQERDGGIIGYGVLSIAADEAHVLN
ncbi:MAG: ribosomal-protein-alanine N-acetyltransferase, partial [Thermomonas sp.]